MWGSIEDLPNSMSDGWVAKGHPKFLIDGVDLIISICGISTRRTQIYSR
jgi:hypothetical protein